jgi:ubiquinone/menaquinone biosynthesis C-methylase UbiE
MHNIALLRVRETVKALELRGIKTALDLGGGPGTYAIALAKRGLDVTLYDMPETMRISRLNAKQAGVKLRFRKGDFMVDEIGKGFDLVFISQIFHAYSEEDNVMLLEKCRTALNPGGRVAVQEALISDDKTRPLRGALFTVNMLVNTVGGRCYSPGEMKRWLKKTGFKHVGEAILGETVLIQGVRD